MYLNIEEKSINAKVKVLNEKMQCDALTLNAKWFKRTVTDSGQAAAAHSGTISGSSSLLPPLTLPWMTFLSSFYMLLCPSYLQLSPPSTSKTWPKPVIEFIHCIRCSFQIHGQIKCQPSLFIHERNVIWKSFYIHLSLLMANPNARPQAIFHVGSH